MSSAAAQLAKIRPSGADILRSPGQRTVVLSLLLVAATFLLYAPVGHHPFVNYDDNRYVIQNVHVTAGLSWDGVKWAFTSYDESNWHPLTWLSHMLDCELFDLDPVGHHYSNLFLHGLNVVALFWVLEQATGSPWRSFMVAALFALHPINVESVAWISERKNLLSMLFFILSLGSYRWYVRGPNWRRYATLAGSFALAAMAKPQVITLPFVLLLWDYWPFERFHSAVTPTVEARQGEKRFSWLVLEKAPLFVISALSGVLTLKAQMAGDAVGSLTRYPFPLRVQNAVVSYLRYLSKAFWPSHLAVSYPYPLTPFAASQVVGALFVLGAISVFVVRLRHRRYFLVGWLWFVGTLVPMIGLVQVGAQAMADRYAYLPFVGCFLLLTWGVADGAELLRVPSRLVIAGSVAVLLALAFVTHRQIGYWGDNVKLWSHALEVTSGNYVAEDGLGGLLLEQGRLEDAIPYYRAAVAMHPSDPIGNLNLGFYAGQHEDWQAALQQYSKVLSLTKDRRMDAEAHLNMGFIYNHLGELDQARESFKAATQLLPGKVLAWIGLGIVAQKSGDFDGALQSYTHALEIRRSDVGYLLLAQLLDRRGQHEQAESALQTAKALSQDFPAARLTADHLLAQ
ncbi:MAG TPA: tetratricopeptide repeat protein [Terriglobales bacterium]|nr:tetratricopeptide repeat protein [Terriglobales bacterium]